MRYLLVVFEQPTFGSKAVSPPGGHQPRPLLPPSDLSETGDGSSCVANDDVRGSGVGSDVGDVEGRWRHCPMILLWSAIECRTLNRGSTGLNPPFAAVSKPGHFRSLHNAPVHLAV